MRSSRYPSLRPLAALAALAVLSLAGTVGAEPAAVLVGGKASQRQQLAASGAAAAALRAAGWTLTGRRYGETASAAATSCLRRPDPWGCISRALGDRRLQRVAVVSVDLEPGKQGAINTVITERLVSANADSLFVAQRFCESCTDDRLAALATEVTKELIDRAAAGSGRTVLVIKSTPQNARAYVDTGLIGVTDASISVAPGAHTITVELEDHEPETRRIVVDEDTTQEVAFALRPRWPAGRPEAFAGGPGDHGLREPSRRSRLLPGALSAVGLGAAATGALLVALDQDPVTTPGVDVPARYRDSGVRGVVIGACGLAIAGTGAYLWWRAASADSRAKSKSKSESRSRSRSRLRSAPIASPVRGGVAVGVVRSF